MAVATLLERAEEQGTIEEVLDGALAARGGVVVIEGEAGVGKTSLLELAGHLALEREMLVLRARGGALERDLPYGLVRQLFEALVRGPAVGQLAGAAALAASVFDPTAEPGGGQAAIQHGLYWLAADLAARQPFVALVDDAQWSDTVSLAALVYLVRRLDGVPAGVVVTVRTGELDAPHELLDALAAAPAIRLAPRALTLGAASDLGRGVFPPADDAFLEACWCATGGNAFLLTAMFRVLAADGVAPTAASADRVAELAAGPVAASVMTRLRTRGNEAVSVARAVAVLDPDTALEHVAAVAELPAQRVAAVCEELIAAHVLTDGLRPRFVHPLLKEAVTADMAAPRRAAMHLVAARTLRAAGVDPGTVAAHLLRTAAVGEPWAVDALAEGAREARARGAPQAAAALLERAVAEPADGERILELREELGMALLDAGDARGVEVLLAVHAGLGDPLRRAEVASMVFPSLGLRGRIPEAEALVTRSLGELPDGCAGLAAHLLAERYMARFWSSAPIGRDDLLRDVASISGESLGERQLLSNAALLLAAGAGRCEDGLDVAERMIATGDALLEDAAAGWMRGNAALPLALAGDIPRALALLDAQLAVARRRGSPTQVASTLQLRAIACFARGDLAEAEADASTAARLVGEAGMAATWPTPRTILAVARLERGDLAGAEHALEPDGPLAGLPRSVPHGQYCVARGRLHAARGRLGPAREAFLAAAERLAPLPYSEIGFGGWRPYLALAEQAAGHDQPAREVAAEAVCLAREAGYPLGLAFALRVEGAVGDEHDRIDRLREAAEVAGGGASRLEQAHCLVELGAALRRAGHRRDAREPLLEGLDLAHRCGAAPLDERARVELAAAGARPRSAVRSGIDALTPSELRVARLAAEGRTNREIAQELFVTAKTIETQLRAVYRKLGIAGRRELPDTLR